MALVLQIDAEITSNCKTIEFYETTKPYSVSNTTGWGTPNDTIASATSAELTVLTPAGNAYTFDATSSIPFYSSWPTTDDDISYDINSSMIGYGTDQKLPDGVYRFSYEVVTSGGTYTQVIEKLFYCNAKCCVHNMIADIDYNCDCSIDKIEKAKKAWIILIGLGYASECGQTDKFENLLDSLNKLCAGDCTNC